MKGNREQIYEFVKLHSSVNANHGISTNEIAEALGMQRTNVSTALGELLREGRVKKSSSRPVLYSLTEAFADEEGAFRELVGYDGSLKYAVQLARAALLYPHRGLNVLLIGREGSGRKYMAEVMHKAAVQQGLVAEQAPFVMCDCMDFGADDAATIAELFGDGVQGGMLAEAATGILFLHKVQFLSVNVRRKLLRCFVEAEDARELPMIFLSCDDKALDVISLLEDHVLAEIRLPSLTERPLPERRKLLEHFLVAEACRTKRTITLESEVLTCLMLFPCEKEILTLKTQIRKACMNAYLRDYMDHGGELHLYISDFDPSVRKGFLNYRADKEAVDALVKPQMRYFYQEGGVTVLAPEMPPAEETQVSEPQIRTDEPSPVLLFVFYGQGVARALSDTIEEQLHRGNVYAVDIPYEQKDEQTYELLRQKLLAIDRGAGVLAVYDQKVLQQMLYTISCETGTQLRAVALPVTRFGMEWSKGAAIADGVDRVYRMAAESLGALWHSPKKVIVTLCTTSEGVALQMKQYLIQHKACTDAEVIALSLSDRKLLREKLLELMQGAVILCIIGTYDPDILAIPFLSAADVLAVPVERLPELLRTQRMEKAEVDFDEMFRCLGDHLEYVDIGRLKEALMELAEQIEGKYPMSLDTKTGLVMHIACAVNRIAGRGVSIENPHREEIVQNYHGVYRDLRKYVAPVERKFHMIFSDDEMANIISILMQIQE